MPDDLISLVLPAVLIGVIGLVIGGIAGYLLAGVQNSDPSGEPRRPKNLVETMRVWKDKRTGVVMVENGQKLYQSVGDLSVRQRQGLMQVVDEVRLWLGVDDLDTRLSSKPTAVDISTTHAPSLPGRVDASGKTASAAPPPPSSSSLIQRLPPQDGINRLGTPEDESGVTAPSLDIADILSRAINPDKSRPAEAPKSIAGQVDDIVQERLPGSAYQDRTIKILDHPKMGLLVVVDGKQFEGINDVTDEGVRQFLRDCVSAWEKRGT